MKQPLSAKSLEQIRTNARRRLIGAIILVILAIAILPWVLESKPRESEVAVPVTIVNQPVAQVDVPLVLPPVQYPEPPVTQPVAIDLPPVTSIDTPIDASLGVPAYVPPFVGTGEGATTLSPEQGVSSEGVGQVLTREGYATRPASRPVITSKIRGNETRSAASSDAQRAATLLGEDPARVVREPVTTTATVSTRVNSDASKSFVVQVGAYADPSKVSEVRAKLTMAGYSSYTQDVQTSAGKTTRVRVGPVGGRQTAEDIAKKISALGLPVSILPS